MADVKVKRGHDNAVLLLQAAEDLEQSADVVRSTSKGYVVDEDLAKKAGVEYVTEEDEAKEREERLKADDEMTGYERDGESAPRKRAAKRAVAKKTAAKTTAAKE